MDDTNLYPEMRQGSFLRPGGQLIPPTQSYLDGHISWGFEQQSKYPHYHPCPLPDRNRVRLDLEVISEKW
jgi:hypothetical protein